MKECDENESTDPILIEENDTGTNDNSLAHKPEDEDEPEQEDDVTVGSDDDEEEGEAGENEEQQQEEVPPASVPRPRAVQELDPNLDGIHWGDGMVGSVIHEYTVESVIQHYGNLDATL